MKTKSRKNIIEIKDKKKEDRILFNLFKNYPISFIVCFIYGLTFINNFFGAFEYGHEFLKFNYFSLFFIVFEVYIVDNFNLILNSKKNGGSNE